MGEGFCVNDCIDDLAVSFSLTEKQRNELLPKSKRSRLYDRVYWAKSYLTKASLVEKFDDETFAITEEGKKTLQMNITVIEDTF